MSIDLKLLQAQQLSMSKQVILTNDFTFSQVDNQPRFIGGTDVGFEENGTITRAAIVILSYPDLTVVEYQIAKVATQLPYIPGLLSFRECPSLVAAWQLIKQKPELLLVDGQGVAHPRRFGLACHLGLLLDTPTIGIAKNRLCGQFQSLPTAVGEATTLMDKNEQIGWVLQSKLRCKPLFVSSGHRICQQTALQWTLNCLRGYRLPEPTRFADAVASNKPLFKKIVQLD